MKKILFAALLCALMVSLSGCGVIDEALGKIGDDINLPTTTNFTKTGYTFNSADTGSNATLGQNFKQTDFGSICNVTTAAKFH